MKLKRQPEDFEVEELTDFAPTEGPFAFYRLTKRSLGTPEVVQAVVGRWKIERRRISYGGLKDRHALTRQFVTIERGPRENLKQSSFELAYLGQAARPFGPKDIKANRFRIVMRDLHPKGAAAARAALEEVGRDGLPNYFDDQRFGSLGESGEFVARAWCGGNYERALWLALAEPNEHDRPRDREQKRMLREGWGNWAALKGTLDRHHRRSIVTFLDDRPGDFRGAIARLSADMRSLYLSAFQSFLWNRLLAATLREVCRPDQVAVVTLKSGEVPFHRRLDDGQRAKLRAMRLPLPSARAETGDEAVRTRLERVTRDAGLEPASMRIRHPRGNFFSKGNRDAVIFPAGLSSDEAADDLYPGRRKRSLRFDLPRGSYATLLVKRVTLL